MADSTVTTTEVFSWKKWFAGMIDVTRILKDVGTFIRLIVICAIVYVLLVGGVALYKRWMPKPPPPKTTIQTVTGSAKVDASTSKLTKWGLVNLW